MKRFRLLFITVAGAMLLTECGAECTNQVEITPSLHFRIGRPSLVTSDGGLPTNINRFRFDEGIYYDVSTSRTQGVVFALLPREQTFVFSLHDANGNSVQKTDLGVTNSRPLDIGKVIRNITNESPKLNHLQVADLLAHELRLKHHPVVTTQEYINDLFTPSEYFVITNSGIYTLDLRVRVWTRDTNGECGVILSPPMRVEVER